MKNLFVCIIISEHNIACCFFKFFFIKELVHSSVVHTFLTRQEILQMKLCSGIENVVRLVLFVVLL